MPTPDQMPTLDQMLSAVETYKKCFATGDKDAWLALFADDAVQIDPYPSPENVGPDAIGGFWDRTFALGSDFQFDGPDPIVAGDRVAMPFSLSMSAGGARYGFDGVDVFEFGEDGRITALTAYWDPTKVRPL